MKLYLNIGLPRTGTTSLQHWLFSKQSGFLGKIGGCETKPNPNFSNSLSKEFTEIVCKSAYLSDEDTLRITKNWLKKVTKNNEDLKKLIVSDEALSSWSSNLNLKDPWPTYKKNEIPSDGIFPIVHWIQNIGLEIFEKNNVKVVITLRDRAKWFTSLYAKESSKFYLASQEHFEKKVDYLINSNNPYMKWGKLINDLIFLLGRENIFISRYERLFCDSQDEIKNIVKFFELEMPQGKVGKQKSQKANDRYVLRRFPSKFYNRIYKNTKNKFPSRLQKFEEKFINSILKYLGREDYILCTKKIQELFFKNYNEDESMIAKIEKNQY